MVTTLDMAQGLPLFFVYDKKKKNTIAILLEDIKYTFNGKEHIIPKGFRSDGASIPKFFWRLIGHPFSMAYLREAIFHDYLYATQIYSKEEADMMLYTDTAIYLAKRKRKLMYAGLKMFGWIAWNKHKKALLEKQKDNA